MKVTFNCNIEKFEVTELRWIMRKTTRIEYDSRVFTVPISLYET